MAAVLVGFVGGASVFELGSIGDMDLFFSCLRSLEGGGIFDKFWQVFLNRLCFNYVGLDAVGEAVDLMGEAFFMFSKLPISSVEAGISAMAKSDGSYLKVDASHTLADLFERYFSAFRHCANSAVSNYKAFSAYPTYTFQAPRIIRADMPRMIIEKKRQLAEYDKLNSDCLPFWKRD